jgi:hypothetical protein
MNLADVISQSVQQAVAQTVPATVAQQVEQALRTRESIQGAVVPKRVGPGPLVSYYSDLSSGLLPPENMRIEDLTYRVVIDPAGNITFESPAVQVISNFNFALRRIVGWNMNPAVQGFAPGLVSFNVVEQARNFSVFKKNVAMTSISAVGGAGNIMEFDGVYISIPGTQLAVTWQVDTQRWPILVGTTKEMGIQLIGDYVICRTEG